MKNDDEDGRLTPAIIEDLKRQGYTQSEIARIRGVSRQAVSKMWRAYGRLTPAQLVLQHFPWKVPAEQTQSSPYRRMRDHGEYVATGGVGMSEDKLSRLRNFYRRLQDEDLVLEFDPALPPIEGVSNKGGFAFRERLPGDGDLMIRVNEHTELTDYGRRIWRVPVTLP